MALQRFPARWATFPGPFLVLLFGWTGMFSAAAAGEGPAGSATSVSGNRAVLLFAEIGETQPKGPTPAATPRVVQAQGTGKQVDPRPATVSFGSAAPMPPRTFAGTRLGRVPNLMGSFFAEPLQVCRTVDTTRTTVLMVHSQANAFGFDVGGDRIGIFGPYSGPNGFASIGGIAQSLDAPITLTGLGQTFAVAPDMNLNGQVITAFPGFAFRNGTATYTDSSNPPPPPRTVQGEVDFFTAVLNYSKTEVGPPLTVCAVLPNPSDGGLVGRTQYFENGSPMPRTRVLFTQQHLGDFKTGYGPNVAINRYVAGYEWAFLDDLLSVDVRLPFASAVGSDQFLGGTLATGRTEIGNLGIAFKAAVVRRPEFLLSLGLGVGIPTADDSRLFLPDGRPLVEVENRAVLLQPLLGMIWAPTERWFLQAGAQFDLDPSGNRVLIQQNGVLAEAGVFRNRHYLFLNTGTGWWLFQDRSGNRIVSGVAALVEVDWLQGMGRRNDLRQGNVVITDGGLQANQLVLTPGMHFSFNERATLALGVVLPATGDRRYDWALQTQLNVRLGSLP